MYRIEALVNGAWAYVAAKDNYSEAAYAMCALVAAYGDRFRIV